MTQQLRDSQAEGQKLNLINKYRRCIVRVQFPPPDKLVLQGTFSITETVEDVVRFIQNFLQVSQIEVFDVSGPNMPTPLTLPSCVKTLNFFVLG